MKDFAIALSKEAAELLRSRFRSGIARRIKDDGSFVTDVDEQVNALVIERVKGRFPTHDVLGEESSNLSDSEYVWVCDPIDGTNAFAHNVPTFVFSLALVHKGVPIIGIIHDPMLDRLYVADTDSPTLLNGRRTNVSSATSIRTTMVGACMLHGAEHELSHVVPRIIDAGGHVQNYGSIAYMAMLVASGEFSCVLFPGTTAHDVAAAAIIVERAGGKVTSFSGDAQSYGSKVDGAILSNGHVHDEIMRVVLASDPR